MSWLNNYWKYVSLPAIAAVAWGAFRWWYPTRKDFDEAKQKKQQQRSADDSAVIDRRVLEALGNSALWDIARPMTGGGIRAVKARELAERLSLDVEVVQDSLERLEAHGRVSNQGGVLADPSPYWIIRPR
jgi:hypothetical protein